MTDAILKEYYYDPEKGFTGATKLFKRLREDGHTDIKMEEIKDFLDRQEINQINRRQYRQQSFIPHYMYQQYQIDLVELKNKGLNKDFSYAFMCIDSFSKRASVEPMKSKTGKSAAVAFENILQRMGETSSVEKKKTIYPESVYCDEGSEFLNKDFKDLLDRHSIELTVTSTHAPIVERLNRTFSTMLDTALQTFKIKTFTTLLQPILDNYNSSYHKTIEMAPNQVTEENSDAVYDAIWRHSLKRYKREKISVGDQVRALLKVKSFKKGYSPKYSEKIHTVTEIDGKYYTLDEKVKGEKKRKYLRFALQKVRKDTEQPDLTKQKNKLLEGTTEKKIIDAGLRVPNHQSKRRQKEMRDLLGRDQTAEERARIKAEPKKYSLRNRN